MKQHEVIYHWQKDPSQLTTQRVQCWLPSGTMQGLVSLADAQAAVKDGRAFVVTCQAIEQYEPCDHNLMVATGFPTNAFKCADCGYVYH